MSAIDRLTSWCEVHQFDGIRFERLSAPPHLAGHWCVIVKTGVWKADDDDIDDGERYLGDGETIEQAALAALEGIQHLTWSAS
jgi:hypothetical protein